MRRTDGKRTVTKKQLVQSISQAKGVHPNDVRRVVQAFLDTVTEHLSQGDRIELRDFGVFEVVRREQKVGRNPKDPSTEIVIPPRNAVKFTQGKRMKQAVEEPV